MKIITQLVILKLLFVYKKQTILFRVIFLVDPRKLTSDSNSAWSNYPKNDM